MRAEVSQEACYADVCWLDRENDSIFEHGRLVVLSSNSQFNQPIFSS